MNNSQSNRFEALFHWCRVCVVLEPFRETECEAAKHQTIRQSGSPSTTKKTSEEWKCEHKKSRAMNNLQRTNPASQMRTMNKSQSNRLETLFHWCLGCMLLEPFRKTNTKGRNTTLPSTLQLRTISEPF
jgi:hypothetical protein